MTRLLLVLGLYLALSFVTFTANAFDDALEMKVEKAKATHEAVVSRAKQELVNALVKKGKGAESAGKPELVRAIQAQQEAFEADGVLPYSVPAAGYFTTVDRATKELIAVLNTTAKSYGKAKELEKAEALSKERDQLQEQLVKAANHLPLDMKGFAPGLLMSEYARAPSQENPNGAFVDLAELKDSISPLVGLPNLRWKFNQQNNAVASGYIRIDEAGEYSFNSNNFYDRNALYIKGQLLCKYRDGEGYIAKVKLTPGYITIQSVGYVESRGTVHVQWIPPKSKELGDIPPTVLFHFNAKK